MRFNEKHFLQRICILAGIGLLAVAGVMMLFWQWNIRTSQKQSQTYVDTLRTLIPEPQSAVLEARRDNTMPVLSLNGTDFIGILEMPLYDSALPVCGDWCEPSRYPHRFGGSIYEGSLQIGGTTQPGQYDFYREISVGDQIFFTDMEGNRYTLEVSDLRYEKHADQAALQRHNVPLTLFLKNIYGFEYLIVFCDVPDL